MVDAWSDRTPSPQEFRREPLNGFDALLDVIKGQGTRLRESTSNLLGSAGIRLKPGRMIVEQSLDVEGELTVTGNTTITGTLSLPAGIIDNAALANPIAFGSSYGSGSSFSLPTAAWVEVSTTSITIPAGFTRMQFTALGMCNAVNSTGSTHNLYVRITRQINGSGPIFNGQQGQIALPAGFSGIATCSYMWNTTGAPGDTHRFALEAWSSGAFAATTNNYSDMDVSALFGR